MTAMLPNLSLKMTCTVTETKCNHPNIKCCFVFLLIIYDNWESDVYLIMSSSNWTKFTSDKEKNSWYLPYIIGKNCMGY